MYYFLINIILLNLNISELSFLNFINGNPYFYSEDAKYEIFILIESPLNCSNNQFIIKNNGITTGHVAVGLKQSVHNETIYNVYGFYPKSSLRAFTLFKDAESVIRNEKDDNFDAIISFSINWFDFEKILRKKECLNGIYFNLCKFNCVDFVLALIQELELNIKIYKKSFIFHKLYTPHSFIEAIKRQVKDRKLVFCIHKDNCCFF
jgi:hypothetical protein